MEAKNMSIEGVREFLIYKTALLRLIPFALSVFIAVPIHCLLIFRVLKKNPYFNDYKKGITLQSTLVIIYIFIGIFALACKLYAALRSGSYFWKAVFFMSGLSLNLCFFAVSITSLHLKSVFKSSPVYDKILIAIVALITLIFIATEFVVFLNKFLQFTPLLNEMGIVQIPSTIFFYLALISVNIFCFIYVRNVDPTKFSSRIIRSQERMSKSLISKSVLLFWILCAYAAVNSFGQNLKEVPAFPLLTTAFIIEVIADITSALYPLLDGSFTWWSISNLMKKRSPKVSIICHPHQPCKLRQNTRLPPLRTTSLPVLM